MIVSILMGSRSDLAVMRAAGEVLDQLGVGWEMRILSAHRTPAEVDAHVAEAPKRGVGVFICGAGMAAHLAGAVAGRTVLPVIGVPLDASLAGLDALLATVQMPPGIPVATVAVGVAGAKNAAWLAAQVLALSDPALSQRLVVARAEQAAAVLAADAELSSR